MQSLIIIHPGSGNGETKCLGPSHTLFQPINSVASGARKGRGIFDCLLSSDMNNPSPGSRPVSLIGAVKVNLGCTCVVSGVSPRVVQRKQTTHAVLTTESSAVVA